MIIIDFNYQHSEYICLQFRKNYFDLKTTGLNFIYIEDYIIKITFSNKRSVTPGILTSE